MHACAYAYVHVHEFKHACQPILITIYSYQQYIYYLLHNNNKLKGPVQACMHVHVKNNTDCCYEQFESIHV